ncbi:MAG: hypothetical protein Barrevirus25_4 [Barrevirus sp.]|uniref:Uncharacterized protein n=1 Tax=Barrevirus sp. TaxID=2487763 RepID=A0A3G4ZTC4_9VIRU|nr:MAG: hypothetical protein Barrevirus25_4 [Barrevirus sp.]
MNDPIKIIKLKRAAGLAALCFISLQKFRSNGTIFRFIQKEIAALIGKMIYNSYLEEDKWNIAVNTLRKESFLKNSYKMDKVENMFLYKLISFKPFVCPLNVKAGVTVIIKRRNKKQKNKGNKVGMYGIKGYMNRFSGSFSHHRLTNEIKKVSKKQFYLSNNL